MKPLIVKTSGQGEPLLLIHGWGMNSSVWQPVKQALESRYTISLLDLPGHGVNRDVEAGSMDELLQLVWPHVHGKTHLLGWSLGGLIAQAMLKDKPQTIATLTLVASTPRFSQAKDWPYAMNHALLDQFAQNLAQDLTGTLKRFIALQFMGIKNSKELQRSLVNRILQSPPRYSALTLGLNFLKSCDYRKNKIERPQHWILGGRDRLIPVEVKDDVQKLRPQGHISIISDAGHAPFMTHPEKFMSLMDGFLIRPENTIC